MMRVAHINGREKYLSTIVMRWNSYKHIIRGYKNPLWNHMCHYGCPPPNVHPYWLPMEAKMPCSSRGHETVLEGIDGHIKIMYWLKLTRCIWATLISLKIYTMKHWTKIAGPLIKFGQSTVLHNVGSGPKSSKRENERLLLEEVFLVSNWNCLSIRNKTCIKAKNSHRVVSHFTGNRNLWQHKEKRIIYLHS